MKHVAIYVRLSKRRGQDVRSQLPDLEKWQPHKMSLSNGTKTGSPARRWIGRAGIAYSTR